MMKISVIVPTLNEENFINHLMQDLLIQTYPNLEIIIVDGGSTDNTIKIINKYKKKLSLIRTTPSIAKQRNLGASKATGDILIFLDADVRLNYKFISSLIERFIKKKADLACTFYLPYKSSLLINSIYIFFDLMFFLFQKISPSGAGNCIIVNKKVFKSIGGFSEKYKFEDIEFIRRASKKRRFSIIFKTIFVSDRRFKKDGLFKTFLKYLLLSFLFLTNQFKFANLIDYKFGDYNLNKK